MPPPERPAPELVATEQDLAALLARAARAQRLAVDVEGSGMHAFRARPCTVQIAWDGAIAVVDVIALPVAALSPLLGAGGPLKIVHDVAFDARLLAEHGIALGPVRDTAIAARMLGRTSTGLASLLAAELGIPISKALQSHDWRLRPIDPAMMEYLGEDVRHLDALERRLWAEVGARGVAEAVTEETAYRVDCAIAAANAAPTPGYLRLKGAERLSARELAALRAVFDVRERAAAARDVPPYRVVAHEGLVELARGRPATAAAVARVRGVPSDAASQALREALAAALSAAPETLPDDESPRRRERPPMAIVQERRAREARLVAWRRDEAKKRGVDEQAVLPGHCLQDAVDMDAKTREELARVPGIGTFRVHADGDAILKALSRPSEETA
jgi:ribonuclease D